jgi:hypothetical protein
MIEKIKSQSAEYKEAATVCKEVVERCKESIQLHKKNGGTQSDKFEKRLKRICDACVVFNGENITIGAKIDNTWNSIKKLQKLLQDIKMNIKVEFKPFKFTDIKFYDHNTKNSIIRTDYAKLKDNSNAHRPTYREVVAFFNADSTKDKKPVTKSQARGTSQKAYYCQHFAVDFHNNAEKAG